MISACVPDAMPALPDGFAEKYTKDTSTVDDASAFHSKAELMELFHQQREGTLAALDQLSDDYAGMFSSVGEFLAQSTVYLLTLAKFILPDFARFDAVESFVNGHNVGLVWVLQALGEMALLKTGIVLGLAVLLFHRREVAEISV